MNTVDLRQANPPWACGPGDFESAPRAKHRERRAPDELSPTLTPDRVDVWFARILGDQPPNAAFTSVLDGPEREREQGYRIDVARHRFARGRALLRHVLADYVGIPANDLCFDYELNGKPLLRGGALAFNVSHSGDVAAVAVSTRIVGIDVEQMRDDLDVAGLAVRYFAPAEARRILEAPPGERFALFFRQWTAKEAWLKARGVGLTAALDVFTILPVDGRDDLHLSWIEPDEPWWIQHLPLDEGIACSIAVAGSRPQVVLHRWSWDRWRR